MRASLAALFATAALLFAGCSAPPPPPVSLDQTPHPVQRDFEGGGWRVYVDNVTEVARSGGAPLPGNRTLPSNYLLMQVVAQRLAPDARPFDFNATALVANASGNGTVPFEVTAPSGIDDLPEGEVALLSMQATVDAATRPTGLRMSWANASAAVDLGQPPGHDAPPAPERPAPRDPALGWRVGNLTFTLAPNPFLAASLGGHPGTVNVTNGGAENVTVRVAVWVVNASVPAYLSADVQGSLAPNVTHAISYATPTGFDDGLLYLQVDRDPQPPLFHLPR